MERYTKRVFPCFVYSIYILQVEAAYHHNSREFRPVICNCRVAHYNSPFLVPKNLYFLFHSSAYSFFLLFSLYPLHPSFVPIYITTKLAALFYTCLCMYLDVIHPLTSFPFGFPTFICALRGMQSILFFFLFLNKILATFYLLLFCYIYIYIYIRLNSIFIFQEIYILF